MMLEPLLVFETILIENRSLLELIDSDFSYRSELLQQWYAEGQQKKNGPPTVIPFTRVQCADRRQGGVITTAAVMTMTSGPERTKPITRGAWIASVVLNDPPEPPPASVEPLPEIDEATAELTLRERLHAHRERSDCAGCHTRIDPLGFAFENYGPTGRWRENYENGREVDASGLLFQRHRFDSVVEFKDGILLEKARLVRGFTEHLLAFALGREIASSDWNAIDGIVRQAEQNDYRLRELMKAVVMSEPFLNPSSEKLHADSK